MHGGIIGSLRMSTVSSVSHTTIVGDDRQEKVLDMTAKQSISTQNISVDLVNDHPSHLQEDWATITRHDTQKTLDNWISPGLKRQSVPYLQMPRTINWQKMKEIYDVHPTKYEELLSLKGVGANTVRALALISDLIYNEKPSWEDPVRFSFTVGGKDGVPYPVNRKAMDESTEIIKQGLRKQKSVKKKKFRRYGD